MGPPESLAQLCLVVLAHIPGLVHLMGKFLQNHGHLPKLHHHRIPALHKPVFPGQIHGGPSQVAVQLSQILVLFPAAGLEHLGHVLIVDMAFLLKGPQEIIQVIAVLLLRVRAQAAFGAAVAHQGRRGLHGRQAVLSCQLPPVFNLVVKRFGQPSQGIRHVSQTPGRIIIHIANASFFFPLFKHKNPSSPRTVQYTQAGGKYLSYFAGLSTKSFDRRGH